MDIEVDERTVDSHIKKLRQKFEGVPEFKIVTIRGLGYKVEKYA
jgi:DNA-binding response OmpR family regulator